MKTANLCAAIAGLLFAGAFVGQAAASCEPGRNPILSLTEGLPVTDLFGAEQGQLGFLEVVYTSEDAAASDQVAIRNHDGSVSGLLEDGQYLIFIGALCEAPPLTMSDVPLTWADRESPLQAKGILGVTDASIAFSDETRTEITIRAAPREDAGQIDTMSLYSIVYVHAQHRDPETGIDWYFVGTTSRIQFRGGEDGQLSVRIANTLLGWVHEHDLVFWPQRQAAFPAGPYARTSVYEDEGLSDEIIQLFFIDERSDQRRDAVLKFPVLEISEANGAYRLAVPTIGGGQAVGGDSEDGRGAIGDIRTAVGFDVLFVLDNTESMQRYRGAVIDGLLYASADLPQFETVRLAFAMFGDTFPDEAAFEAWSYASPRNGLDPSWVDLMHRGQRFQYWLSDFGNPGFVPTAGDIANEFGGVYIDPRSDLPEMGIPAVELAIRTASWRNGSIRIVFYLGDDASREGPSERLVTLMEDEEVILIPINVAGENPGDDFNERWMAQMRELSRRLDAEMGYGMALDPVQSFEIAGNNSEISATADRVQDVIASAIYVREVLIGQGQLDDLNALRTAAQARAAEYGVADARLVVNLFENFVGGDVDALQARLSQSDIVVEGYYPIDDAEIFVALTASELHAITGAIGSACIGMGDTASLDATMEDMAEGLARSFLGERQSISFAGAQETIPEFFAQLTHLPADYFSVFGDRTIDEFLDWVFTASPREYNAVQSELCLSLLLLELISDGVNGRRDTFNEVGRVSNVPIFAPRTDELPNFDWLWNNESGIAIYFVPQEFFPRTVVGQ